MRRAIFWDLQGTLGGEATDSIENFQPYPFSKEALLRAKSNGYYNIVISNQSGVAKGIITKECCVKRIEYILNFFNSERILIDDFLCCMHKSEDFCNCKKPKTGWIKTSVEKYNLDIKECFVVGDMGKNEIIMANNAGCKGVLVLTGGGKASLGKFRHTWSSYEADMIAENVLDFIMRIT